MRSVRETLLLEPVLPPAPGADRYPALDFADSTYALPGDQRVDLLGTAEATNRWLTAHGLAPAGAGVQDRCAAQLRMLREHIRALFAAHIARRPPAPAALAAVNESLTRIPTAPPLRWDDTTGPYRATLCPPDRILDRALATLAADAADLLTDPDVDRLTACDSAPCDRFLIRHGRRRHWCSTRCGDRVRAARAYARAKARTD